MIKIEKFVFSPFSENTYIIWEDVLFEAAIVDPGCSDESEEKIISDFISKNNLNIKYLINTHCHIDHIFGCEFIKQKYNPIYLIPEKDLSLLQNADKQAETFGIEMRIPPNPDKFIEENMILALAENEIKFLFTPGHTEGEYCIYLQKDKLLISGDVLFKGSIGRTDLWGGDYNTLIISINNKLLSLPNDVKVFPGHGEETTIGNEKEFNPFLK